MGYRICYGKERHGRWLWSGVWAGAAVWCAFRLGSVWQAMAAGEGAYDALARFVGGMIRGAR